jgi:hypothetical protein
MHKDPLPAEFVAFIRTLSTAQDLRDPRRMFRGLVIRWCLWRDGVESNALPGYSAPPPQDESTGFPIGWSQQKIAAIVKETIGTAAIHQTRRAASLQSSTRIDCGSGQHYGICKDCGQGHGHVLVRDGKPTSLVTSAR